MLGFSFQVPFWKSRNSFGQSGNVSRRDGQSNLSIDARPSFRPS